MRQGSSRVVSDFTVCTSFFYCGLFFFFFILFFLKFLVISFGKSSRRAVGLCLVFRFFVVVLAGMSDRFVRVK